MMSKLKSLGFSSGHAHLLLVAVAVFSVLIVTKSGINVRAMFANADSEVKVPTYEDIKKEVESEKNTSTNNSSDYIDEQIALLDRSLENGQVLGDATGIGTVPNIEKVFTREQLDQIKLNTVSTDSKSVQSYANSLLNVESQTDAATLMASLNSSDPAVLKQTAAQADAIIQKLSTLTVPAELADFNRYKMIYYESMSSMANGFATNTLDTNFQNTSKIFFSVVNKIEQTKTDIQQKYQVSL